MTELSGKDGKNEYFDVSNTNFKDLDFHDYLTRRKWVKQLHELFINTLQKTPGIWIIYSIYFLLLDKNDA